MYSLDTNAIIYYLKGKENAVFILDDIFQNHKPVYISTIVEAELFSFSNINSGEIELIENILKTLSIIPLDSNIARVSGYIRRLYNLDTADSVIAATALFTGSTLITRNIKHFKNISNFNIQKI